MDPQTRSLIDALERLSTRARVALGCIAVEHVLDLYKLGNVKLRVADVNAKLAAPPERDLIELGLELAWQFATSGKNDQATIKPIVELLDGRPFLEKPTHLSLAANAPIMGLTDTLMAIEDSGRRAIGFALSRSRGGVFEIISDFDPDEDAPAAEQQREQAWQLKVALRLVAHGDAPITHALFDDVLAEQLPWRTHLNAHAAKYAAGAAPVAAQAKPKTNGAKPTANKAEPATKAAKPATKPTKPAAKKKR